MRRLESLEQDLGISFKDQGLLQLALVHSSYLNENPGVFPEPNERLEFLGDALIGLVVAHELYLRHPNSQEGELTTRRSALVRGAMLARIGDSLSLGDCLLLGKGEEASGGRMRQSNLAAAFEALLGALFIDQGYTTAREFVLRLLTEELSVIDQHSFITNPKSALQELLQGKGMDSPSYVLADTTGKDHARMFEVEVMVSGEAMGRGTGRRKSIAEQEAAREALEALGYEA